MLEVLVPIQLQAKKHGGQEEPRLNRTGDAVREQSGVDPVGRPAGTDSSAARSQRAERDSSAELPGVAWVRRGGRPPAGAGSLRGFVPQLREGGGSDPGSPGSVEFLGFAGLRGGKCGEVERVPGAGPVEPRRPPKLPHLWPPQNPPPGLILTADRRLLRRDVTLAPHLGEGGEE